MCFPCPLHPPLLFSDLFIKKDTSILALSLLFVHAFIRIFLREDVNLVFDKWLIVFTDISETAKLYIFPKNPIQVITGKLLVLLKMLNLLNEKYREDSKGWRFTLKMNKDSQVYVQVRNNPFKRFCPILLLFLNFLIIQGKDVLEESGQFELMLERSPFSRKLWIYLSK